MILPFRIPTVVILRRSLDQLLDRLVQPMYVGIFKC